MESRCRSVCAAALTTEVALACDSGWITGYPEVILPVYGQGIRLFIRRSGVDVNLVKSLDKRLDKLDKFDVLQSTSQLECKPMRERGIRWSGRFDLHCRPPGPRPGGQRIYVCL
jgi:hypothetical protein